VKNLGNTRWGRRGFAKFKKGRGGGVPNPDREAPKHEVDIGLTRTGY